jgi:hemoglobin
MPSAKWNARSKSVNINDRAALPFVPPIHPSQIVSPSREIYAVMGEENITRMVQDFYAELGQSSIRDMFPRDMQASAKKSAAFFVGLLGGPPLYHQQYGSPMMRARHMPFPINQHTRDVWLECFERVLIDAPARYEFPSAHLEDFREFLRGFSLWMMNKE